MTWIIAHRGAWGPGAPQNTLAAFERAVELGADMVELDVRRSAAGTVVVSHDPPADGQRRSRTPLLAEALELCRGRIGVNVEIKEPGCLAEVLGLVRHGDDCLLTSFHEQVVREARALAPWLRTGLCVQAAACMPAFERSGAHYPVLERGLDAGGVDHIVWTVNEPAELERVLQDPAVLGVITDVPQLALERRAELSLPAEPSASTGLTARTAPAAPS